jgi:hypothetical protein
MTKKKKKKLLFFHKEKKVSKEQAAEAADERKWDNKCIVFQSHAYKLHDLIFRRRFPNFGKRRTRRARIQGNVVRAAHSRKQDTAAAPGDNNVFLKHVAIMQLLPK